MLEVSTNKFAQVKDVLGRVSEISDAVEELKKNLVELGKKMAMAESKLYIITHKAQQVAKQLLEEQRK